MGNDTNRKSAPQIAALLDTINTALSGEAGSKFPVDSATRTALNAQGASIKAAITDSDVARAREKQSIIHKEGQREAAVRLIGRVAAGLYNDPLVTPAMIASLGLEPRKSPTRPAMPTRVTALEALPNVDGTCLVRFNKGANRTTTLYDIQTSSDGLLWETATTTLKSSERIAGCPPGEARWFRVVARNSVGVVEPSLSASIYAPNVAPVKLQLAG